MDDVTSAASALNDRGAALDFEVSVAEMDELEGGLLSPKVRDTLMGRSLGSVDNGKQAGQQGMCSCFTLAYYQPFFDVDTSDVQQRLLRAVLPFKSNPTFFELASVSPDAYGPFWLSITLMFLLASCSNVASYWDFDGDRRDWAYDFGRVVSACTLVEIFHVGIPTVLWLIGKYVSLPVTLSYVLCLYGYSAVVFIPASIVCMVPLDGLDWVVILLSMSWSLYFLLSGLWGVIAEHLPKEKMLPVLAFISASHLMWAILVKLLFF